MKPSRVYWDEEERFANAAARAYRWFIVVSAAGLAALGIATWQLDLVLAAVGVLAIGVGALALWIIVAAPIMVVFVGAVSAVRWLRNVFNSRRPAA